MHPSVRHSRSSQSKRPPRIYMRAGRRSEETPLCREKDRTLSHILASLLLLVLLFIGLRATATAEPSPSASNIAPALHISRAHASL
ncbi:exported protein of unknown function [Candidatus Filomicrobium marinum]|uniref:Uncharacterized protein n=2 Tax=Filomicrobium TaxID=119044 RepID=A0A0D6JJR2_9HYPH|nr:exported protein of unknown function [Candidatus Filomicrobium marinum]CPR22229.1 exported protein of unknown function [Candidatus Filomicrobium marinum]SDO91774.1 hypothetical protein SAMN04488061_1999 [Filomicrobium insigne]